MKAALYGLATHVGVLLQTHGPLMTRLSCTRVIQSITPTLMTLIDPCLCASIKGSRVAILKTTTRTDRATRWIAPNDRAYASKITTSMSRLSQARL